MHVAADMLRHDRHNACSVAYSVGFNSGAAFNRALKREFGLPPAAWQRTQAVMEQASSSTTASPAPIAAVPS